jgi:hypothetical protein
MQWVNNLNKQEVTSMMKNFMALIIALLFVFSVSGITFAEESPKASTAGDKKQSLSGTKFCKGQNCPSAKDTGETATTKKTTSTNKKTTPTKKKYQAK